MIRVCVVDDQQLVRHGIRAVLEQAHNIKVVGDASDGLEAIDLFRELAPDVIILDVAMPLLDGLMTTRVLKSYTYPPRVLLFSSNDCFESVERAKRVGADGFLSKTTGYGEIVTAVQTVHQGNSFFPKPDHLIPCT